jgi:short-subunit dehydrogenase
MGLLGYSNSLREEVRKHNIRIINIIPGATETSMWSQEVRREKGERMMSPESIARVIVSAYLQKDNLVTEEIKLRPVTGDLD